MEKGLKGSLQREDFHLQGNDRSNGKEISSTFLDTFEFIVLESRNIPPAIWTGIQHFLEEKVLQASKRDQIDRRTIFFYQVYDNLYYLNNVPTTNENIVSRSWYEVTELRYFMLIKDTRFREIKKRCRVQL